MITNLDKDLSNVITSTDQVHPVEGGSYWLAPYWIDTCLVDVFDVEGRFLGEVAIPDGFRFFPAPYIKDDTVIAHIEGADGVPRVKRYRLVIP